jgi:hypothetical protein
MVKTIADESVGNTPAPEL